MNSKLLYAATLALSLTSTFASAQQAAPLTRAQVEAQTRAAIASGTLKQNDYDIGSYRAEPTRSNMTRAQVELEFAQARAERKTLVGPDADDNYNPAGTAIYAVSTLPRNEVKNEVLAAAAAGTLQRTDYDDAASLTRKAQQHAAGVRFAQRFQKKSTQSGN